MKKSNETVNPLDFLSEKALEALTATVTDRVIKSIGKPSDNSSLKLYTIGEVAEKLRMSSVMIRKLCHEGKIGFLRPGDRSMMITQEQLNQYIQSIQNSPQ